MTQDGIAGAQALRSERLEAFLAQDPENPSLLLDTADAALGDGRTDLVEHLVARLGALGPLPPQAMHIDGMAAMQRLDWSRAAERFETLLDQGHDAPPVRFNLAWSLAMEGKFESALDRIDEATSDALSQAAQLEIQLRHQLGEFEAAGERARQLLAIHPDHPGLNAVVSTLALDIEDEALAARAAAAGGDHPDALVTRGTLALADESVDQAAPLFDAALARAPQSPRALIGRGLVRLLRGDRAASAGDLDKAAELFGDHLGSWIAAGWAHLLAGDTALARARFAHALSLDDGFAESHGSLGVIDILEGRVAEGEREIAIAQRLDRSSFAAAFGSILLAAGRSDTETARRISERAITAPIDAQGRTIADAIARMGIGG